jgi:hypothetical protein
MVRQLTSWPTAGVGLPCVVLFIASLAACAGVEWTEYRSDAARFAASFPGKPTESTKTANTAVGSIEMKMYGVSQRQTAFSVAVADYPPDQVKQLGPVTILDGARDGAVATTQGKLLSELIIDMAGNPGREVKIGIAGGKATVRAKILLVGNRLYQIIAVTPMEDSYAPQVRRFLDSFRLL